MQKLRLVSFLAHFSSSRPELNLTNMLRFEKLRLTGSHGCGVAQTSRLRGARKRNSGGIMDFNVAAKLISLPMTK